MKTKNINIFIGLLIFGLSFACSFILLTGHKDKPRINTAKSEEMDVRPDPDSSNKQIIKLKEDLPQGIQNESGLSTQQNTFQQLLNKAQKGDVQTMYDIAELYREGRGVIQNDEKAFEWMLRSAEAGNALAMTKLHVMYSEGSGVRKNELESEKWRRKAAYAGCGISMFTLGSDLYEGEKVKCDYVEAYALLTLAYASNFELPRIMDFVHRQPLLSKMSSLELSKGKKRAEELLEDIYRKPAEEGNIDAMYSLGMIYYDEYGIGQDIDKAIEWFEKAGDQGHIVSMLCLGLIYNNEGAFHDEYRAADWMEKAAEAGNEDAMHNISIFYEEGTGVVKNYKKAFEWRMKLALKGNEKGMGALGYMYYEGIGVPQDFIEAYAWASAAFINGFEKAKDFRNIILDELPPSQVMAAQERAKEINQMISKGIENGIDSSNSETIAGSGTCFCISENGYFITASHVVKEALKVDIIYHGETYNATVKAIDDSTDTAILNIRAKELEAVTIISSKNVKEGQDVYTVGFPNIDIQGFAPKYTDGAISSLSGINDNLKMFQISVPIQPGNSGGPLFDEKGQVIGVVIAKLNEVKMLLEEGSLPQNVNYAIKSSFIIPLLESLPDIQLEESSKMDRAESIEKAKKAVGLVVCFE